MQLLPASSAAGWQQSTGITSCILTPWKTTSTLWVVVFHFTTDLPGLRHSLQVYGALNSAKCMYIPQIMYETFAATFRAGSECRIQAQPQLGWLTGRMLSFQRPYR